MGLLLVAVLHFISDEENPGDLVERLTRPLASGSYLTIAHTTFDHQPERSWNYAGVGRKP